VEQHSQALALVLWSTAAKLLFQAVARALAFWPEKKATGWLQAMAGRQAL
jgi:hypothetical protein